MILQKYRKICNLFEAVASNKQTNYKYEHLKDF